MARIKVTAYVETDDLDPSEVDLTHEMGLSSEGYERFAVNPQLLPLDDVEFRLEEEDA